MNRKKILALMCSFVLTGTLLISDYAAAAGRFSSVSADDVPEDSSEITEESEEDYSSGDVNGDGTINVFDLNRLNMYLCGNLELDDEQKKAADFNYDKRIDKNDLYMMNEYLTLYSDMPVDYYRKRLILDAGNFCLKYGDTTDISLRIRIPDDWKKDSVSVFCNDEKTAEIPFSELTEGEKSTLGDYTYTEYTVSVPVEDYGDDDTRGFSLDLTIEMNGHISNPVMLNRAVKNADEILDDAGAVLNDLNGYVSELSGTDEEIISAAKKWIESNDKLEITGVTSDRIDFLTSYGFSVFFEINNEEDTVINEAEENDLSHNQISTTENAFANNTLFGLANAPADNTESENTEESGFQPNEDKDRLLSIYKNCSDVVQSSNDVLTVKDPDILLLSQLKDDDVISSINPALSSLVNKIHKFLNSGSVDEKIGEQYCSWDAFDCWDQYGTVFWSTHGGSVEKNKKIAADGLKVHNSYNKQVCYSIYKDDIVKTVTKAKEMAESLPETLNNSDFEVSETNKNKWEYLDGFTVGMIMIRDKNSGLKMTTELAVCSSLLMQLLSDKEFPNTVFYFTACEGLSDYRFNDFFIRHGAAAVIGFAKKVSTKMEYYLSERIFSKAIEFRDNQSETYSLNYAVDLANLLSDMNYMDYMQQEVNNISTTADIVSDKDFYYRGFGQLKGHVNLDRHGAVNNNIKDATVKAYRCFNGEMMFMKQESTDSDGNFSMNVLRWGYYLLHVYNDEGEAFLKVDFTDESLDVGTITIYPDDYTPYDMLVNDGKSHYYTHEHADAKWYIDNTSGYEQLGQVLGNDPPDENPDSWYWPYHNMFAVESDLTQISIDGKLYSFTKGNKYFGGIHWKKTDFDPERGDCREYFKFPSDVNVEKITYVSDGGETVKIDYKVSNPKNVLVGMIIPMDERTHGYSGQQGVSDYYINVPGHGTIDKQTEFVKNDVPDHFTVMNKLFLSRLSKNDIQYPSASEKYPYYDYRINFSAANDSLAGKPDKIVFADTEKFCSSFAYHEINILGIIVYEYIYNLKYAEKADIAYGVTALFTWDAKTFDEKTFSLAISLEP